MTTSRTAPIDSQKSSRAQKTIDGLVNAATEMLNRAGFSGVKVADVASQVGLTTTIVSYHFRRKEDLIAECLLRAIRRFELLVNEALSAPEPEDRISLFIRYYFELLRGIEQGDEPPLADFSAMRALQEPNASVVGEAFLGMFRQLRRMFSSPGLDYLTKDDRNARAFLLLSLTTWVPAWIHQYDASDYPRLADRMVEILMKGLAASKNRTLRPKAIPQDRLAERIVRDQLSKDLFLVAATSLVNEQGYRGASVDKIATRLNVTKGAFYHHIDAKDNLILDCFDRTFRIIKRAQEAALELHSDNWTTLVSASHALLEFQLSDQGPLLRSTALNALPEDAKHGVFQKSQRVSLRFASILMDGFADGSIRPVDALVASQLVLATINSSVELPFWVGKIEPRRAIDSYLRPALLGILTR